jgi:hypothetical protein
MAIDDGEAALNEVLDLLRKRVMMELRVALPARINRVKANTGRVDLEVQLLLPRVNPELAPDRVPILMDVPVLYPSSTACAIRFALAVGDPGLIVFTDHALGSWLLAGDVVAPAVVAPHGFSGAVFLPGLWPGGPAGVTIPSEGVVVEVREGEALEVVGNEVRAGRGASDALATQDNLDAVASWADGIFTTIATSLGATFPGPPSQTGTTVTKGK